MTKNPPAPIMSKNHPGPTTGHPKGSRIPDVIVLWDGTKPPTQGNIKKVIEIKFPPDSFTEQQAFQYGMIAGGAPVEVWGPDNPCNCPEEVKEPVFDKVLDVVTVLALLTAIALMLADDTLPGGQIDDPLIPLAVAKLMEKLAPLLSRLAPVIPPVIVP